VRVSGEKGGLELSVADDGIGFDPKAAGRGGFGLVLVESLAAQIGASARCERAEPRGTRWLLSMGTRS